MQSTIRSLFFILLLLGASSVWGQPPVRLSELPGLREKLNSENILERIEVLDALVIYKRDRHMNAPELPHLLVREDFSLVITKILEKDLSSIDEKTAERTFSKAAFLVRQFSLFEHTRKIVAYIPTFLPTATSYYPRTSILSGILNIVLAADAREFAPQIAKLLTTAPSLYEEALNALVELKSKEAVPALISRLYDKEPYKRQKAVEDLLEVGGREASPSIARLLGDQEPNLQHTALHALVAFKTHRPYVSQIWELYSSNESLRPVALAALVEAGDKKAIPLSIDMALETRGGAISGNLKPFVDIDARQIIGPLIAKLQEPSLVSDIGLDSHLRSYFIQTLKEFGAKEAIPILIQYVQQPNRFLQRTSADALGELEAADAVDALRAMFRRDVPSGSKPIGSHTLDSAEAALALAKIGDKKVWNDLITAAENLSYPYRSQIIIELNRHIDKDLWSRALELKLSQKLPNRGNRTIVSIRELADIYSIDTGIPVDLEFEPGKDIAKRQALAPPYKDTNGYPWAYSFGNLSLLDGLREFPAIISDGTLPQNFTFIFDNKRIRILSVEKAILWWRNRVLSR